MFEDEDEDYFEGNLSEDIERFEAHLKGDSIGFLDSDRLEAIIDVEIYVVFNIGY